MVVGMAMRCGQVTDSGIIRHRPNVQIDGMIAAVAGGDLGGHRSTMRSVRLIA